MPSRKQQRKADCIIKMMEDPVILKDETFLKLSEFVEKRFGIKLPLEKKIMVQARLQRRLGILKIKNFETYLDIVFSDLQQDGEMVHMIDALSTNKTDFFRESTHFEILKDAILPQLCRLWDFTWSKPLIIWSAACSSGQEPYTIAMVTEEFKSESKKRFEYAILATDISATMLKHAQKGIYSSDLVTEVVSAQIQKKYLLKSKEPKNQLVRIIPELRKKVFFHRLNLMDSNFGIQQPVHIIFCRNVMIYFNREKQAALQRKFYEILEPDGILFLGHSENLINSELSWKQLYPTVYQKTSNQF